MFCAFIYAFYKCLALLAMTCSGIEQPLLNLVESSVWKFRKKFHEYNNSCARWYVYFCSNLTSLSFIMAWQESTTAVMFSYVLKELKYWNPLYIGQQQNIWIWRRIDHDWINIGENTWNNVLENHKSWTLHNYLCKQFQNIILWCALSFLSFRNWILHD